MKKRKLLSLVLRYFEELIKYKVVFVDRHFLNLHLNVFLVVSISFIMIRFDIGIFGLLNSTRKVMFNLKKFF